MKGLKIGELARLAGVTNDTVRFYERCGLIAPKARSESNYRLYNEEDVERLRFIRRAKTLGFTLNEIGELMTLQHDPQATRADIKKRTLAKIENVEQKINDLIRIKTALEHLATECDGQGSLEGCPIMAALTGDLAEECGHLDDSGAS